MSIEDLDNKTLWEELQKAGLADKLETQQEWKLLKEASNRIIERAVKEFAINVTVSPDPKDLAKIMTLQIILRKYKFGLFREVDILKEESEYLFEEAKSRGIVGETWAKVKEKLWMTG